METKNKIAQTDALANVRGRIIEEIESLFNKMCVDARPNAFLGERKICKNVPLYLPNQNERIWNGDEIVWDVYKFKDNLNDQIWVETGEDYYTLAELYADDLMIILNLMDWLNECPEQYQKYKDYYYNGTEPEED